MAEHEELRKIIQEEDQAAYDQWLANSRENFVIGELAPNLTAEVSRELGSVFGYQQAVKIGYQLTRDDLYHASKNDQIDVLDFVLQFVHPNQAPASLQMAVMNQNHDVIDRLLQAGATPTKYDGTTAVMNHDITLVYKLYLHGLLPTVGMAETAVLLDDTRMLEALLNIHPGLDFSLENCSEKMAFEFFDSIPGPREALPMLERHDRRCVLLLVVNPELTEMVIDYTLENNSIDGLEAILMIALFIDNIFTDKLVTIAARMNSTKLITFVPKPAYQGIKVPGYDYPLIEAIAVGNKEIVEVFLRKRMPTDVISLRGLSPVMLAVANDDVDILRMLLERGVSTKSIGVHSPLSVAVAYNSLRCFELLEKNVVCKEDNCMEINQGRLISINLQRASPEMKALMEIYHDI